MKHLQKFECALLGIVAGCIFTLSVFGIVHPTAFDKTKTAVPRIEARDCLTTGAPMWSDSWCKSCYALWDQLR